MPRHEPPSSRLCPGGCRARAGRGPGKLGAVASPDRLRSGLASIRGIKIRDLGRAPGAIVSFTIEGYQAEAVVRSAAAAGITIGASDPSSTRIDAEVRSLPPVVRASPHYYNTEAEIDRLIGHVAGLTPR